MQTIKAHSMRLQSSFKVNVQSMMGIFEDMEGTEDMNVLNEGYAQFMVAGADCSVEVTEPILKAYERLCLTMWDLMHTAGIVRRLTRREDGAVPRQVKVTNTEIATLQEMLNKMKELADKQGTKRGSGAGHVDHFNPFFDDPLFDGADYDKRKSGRGLNTTKGLVRTLVGGRAEYKRSDTVGLYSMTTALKHIMDSDNDRYAEIESRFRRFLRTAVPQEADEEMALEYGKRKHVIETVLMELQDAESWGGAGKAGSILSNKANIDCLFTSYYMVFEIAKIKAYKDFIVLNEFLYRLSVNPKGREKVDRLFNNAMSPCIKAIAKKLSKCTDIHLPPYIMTPARVQDMTAVFGTLSTREPEALVKCGASERFFINLRRELSDTFTFIAAAYRLEKAAKDGVAVGADVFCSLHMFHQLLTGKVFALNNIHDKSGNAMNVELVAEVLQAKAGTSRAVRH